MGGLAHYLEDAGIATTQISLIREHSEQIRPPRALWVPFAMGRPLGAVHDPTFQRRVLVRALELLDADRGPVLADYDREAPDEAGQLGWRPQLPVGPASPADLEPAALAARLSEEAAALLPHHQAAIQSRGRTAVGLSGLDLAAAAAFVGAFLDGKVPPNPYPDLRISDVFRATTEDLKTAYCETATTAPGQPSWRQVADWFWGDTVAGQTLLRLKPILLAGSDRRFQLLAGGLLVPRLQVHRLE